MASVIATASSTSFHRATAFTSPRSTASTHPPPPSVTFRRKLPSISAVYATVDTTATTSFYDVLGVQNGASGKEIKAAYRRLARAVHPDALAFNGQKDATSAADEFIRVHEAYATLSDPRKKADYDKMMVFKRRRIGYSPNYAVSTPKYATTSFSGFSGHTHRSWETDQCW